MTAETKELRAALVSAQRDAKSIDKGDRNKHGGFDYSSREAIAAHSKALLGAHGLAFSLRGPSQMTAGTGLALDSTTKKMAAQPVEFAHFIGVLTHESGEQEEWPVVWAVDYARKGMTREQRVGTSAAYAQKNVLLQLLNIPRGADDVDSHDNQHPAGGRQEPARRAPPTQEQRDKAALVKLQRAAGYTRENAGDIAGYLAAQYNLKPDAPISYRLGVLRNFDRDHGIDNLLDHVIDWDSKRKADEADKEANQ